MKRNLFLKILAGYLIFLAIGFLVILTFTSTKTYTYLEKETATDLYLEAKTLSDGYVSDYYSNRISLSDVKNILSALDTYLDASIWIVDTKGDILIASSATTYGSIEFFSIEDFGTSYYQIGTFYGLLNEKSLTVYAPIVSGYKISGYVLIHKSVSSITAYGDGFLNIAHLTFIFILLLGLLPLAALLLGILRPIKKIKKGVDSYAAGKFDYRIDLSPTDELGYLAASLEHMASRLGTQEEDQRKFIANVSHDFRSPLTSIRGYIQAIMDGTIPPELHEKYLTVVLNETDRLNKLTEGMLELSKYGTKGALLDVSDFDINQIIKQTVLSFEGTCLKRRISFQLILTNTELFVRGDMSKIQQVLYNLIDNAIKFSHADSTITIETTVRNDKVFVSVKDTGIGIPKESLKKIFERFYKTDLSRGKDKKGTGLGLAIVKEIIQAHGENINVISTEGVGSEFIFTLPLTNLPL